VIAFNHNNPFIIIIIIIISSASMDNMRIYHLDSPTISDRTPFQVVLGHQKSVISDISRHFACVLLHRKIIC
jgi:hypothetical protein